MTRALVTFAGTAGTSATGGLLDEQATKKDVKPIAKARVIDGDKRCVFKR
ncbi:hypothetical protein IMCC3088_2439 [Aequoribacter fuscus]|uniref:Uncharacterized protein n=1 Tax=Aequoribacter fuscus TaxID=2518989 RepID=F3L458_9GAMM|nr:hypothetical protein IMCC3088_2439 [Aequoribacter fuscus]